MTSEDPVDMAVLQPESNAGRGKWDFETHQAYPHASFVRLFVRHDGICCKATVENSPARPTKSRAR